MNDSAVNSDDLSSGPTSTGLRERSVASILGESISSPQQQQTPTSSRGLPSRTTINFLLDLLLLIVFMALLGTAVVVQFVFPPGPDAAGWQVWGGSYLQWSGLQFGLLCLLTLGILLHVMLHWSWVCSVAARLLSRGQRGSATKLDDGTRTLWGVATLIVILHLIAIAVAAAWLSVQPPLP